MLDSVQSYNQADGKLFLQLECVFQQEYSPCEYYTKACVGQAA